MHENRAPALLGALLLHVLVLGAGLITLPFWSKPIEVVNSVPVTIVSHAPTAPPTAPTVAPEPAPETTPEPAPEPQPPPPPKPAPVPAPAPVPRPAPPPPTPAQPKPLDLGALANSLPQAKPQPNKNARPATKPVDLASLAASLPKSVGARGPARPAAAAVQGPVTQLTGDEISALQGKLGRLWGLNCGVDDAQELTFRVKFRLRPDGQLEGSPELLDRPIVEARGGLAMTLARRALTAVVRGDPYSELPKDRYSAWKEVTATFDTKKACANSR